MQKLVISVALTVVLVVFSGCSVAKSASSREGTNLSAVSQGISKSMAEEVLGAPQSSSTTPEGEWVTYKYVKPKEGHSGRAVMHGVFDVLTLGLWEIAGTPIEAGIDHKYGMIQVLYDKSTNLVVRTRKVTK